MTNENVESIAFDLGYSDARSFRRFIRNATELTPQQIRDRCWIEDSQEHLRVLLEIKTLSDRMNI